jgi:Peptidase family M23
MKVWGMLRVASVVAISCLCVLARVGAAEMQAPRITRAEVDWDGAAAKLGEITPLQAVHASAEAVVPSSEVGRLNAAVAERLPGIERSPVPVLLPFDVDAFLRDRAAGNLRTGPESDPSGDPDAPYFAGFGHPPFFDPGPAGYDATFRFALTSVPELADIRFAAPVDITITGSLLTYELDPPVSDAGTAVPALEADFPGIRRIMLENRVRYIFVRFGVPYVVSTDCFDASFARFHHIACRDADRVIERFLRALRIAGGMPPAAPQTATVPAPERPAEVSPTFTYDAPGRLIPGTGFRNNGGRADYTAYSNIGFPLAEAPAFANTQYYKHRVAGGVLGYPWRDNFCENRSYGVGQCPGGMGHQGQDIRVADCNQTSAGDDRCSPHHNDVVAVRDGMILRAAGQEAVYLVVNTPTEHIRFRYLHMRPKLLDADGVLSGRKVKAGEVIGQIGNFSQRENGTSYHLHFDAQVPTRAGWVFVNPYMTLVGAYERLIGGRGTEFSADVVASAATTMSDAAGPGVITLAAIQHAILAPAERVTAATEAASARLAAPRCGAWRHRHWVGCNQRAAGVRGFRGRYGVHAVRNLRHGYAARAAAVSHRFYRRHRS